MIKYKKAEIAILTHWVKISHSEWEWNGWLLLLLVWSVRSLTREDSQGGHQRGRWEKLRKIAPHSQHSEELRRRRPSTVVHSHSKPTHPQNAESGEKRAFSIESSQAPRALRARKRKISWSGWPKRKGNFWMKNIYQRERECVGAWVEVTSCSGYNRKILRKVEFFCVV